MSENNSFASHFIELRSRLIKSLIFIFVIFVISYTFAEHIYNFLVNPYAEAVKDDTLTRRLIFTALHETFITYLKVAFFLQFFLEAQFCLFKFINLLRLDYIKMKKSLVTLFNINSNTFLLGGMLVYYLVMPLAIKFFFLLRRWVQTQVCLYS